MKLDRLEHKNRYNKVDNCVNGLGVVSKSFENKSKLVLETKTRYFETQFDHPSKSENPDRTVVNNNNKKKRRFSPVLDIGVLGNERMKIRNTEKEENYQDLAQKN